MAKPPFVMSQKGFSSLWSFLSLTLMILFTALSAHCSVIHSYDHKSVHDALLCLREITERQFKFNAKGFMVMTKTFNLSHEADDVQNIVFKYAHLHSKTAFMVIGNDCEDLWWRKSGSSVVAKNDSHTDSDDLGFTSAEDVFIQSHLLFIRLSDFYVMVVDGYRMFNSKIRQLVRIPSWNARAPMIVYITAHTLSKRRMTMYPVHILRTLWSYHVINVALLVHNYQNHSIIHIYSWNPYDPPRRCGEKNQDTKKYAEVYDMCINGSLVNKTNLFPDKVPKNLMKCPLNVLGVIWHPFVNHNRTEPYAGFDRRILEIIAQRLNFTIRLDTTVNYWGDRTENGSWDGMLGSLKKGLGEISIGGIYPDNDVHEDFDPSQSYLQDSFAWVVPRARETPEWENLIIVLKPTMWLASGVIYFLCTLVWYLMAKAYWENGIKLKGCVPSILDTWCINLGVSTVYRPISYSFRIYFLSFCVYSMLWCSIYQTKLITVLTQPTYEKQITTIDELVRSKLKFGGNMNFRALFDRDADEIEKYFFDNYLTLDVHKVLDHVISYRNVSVLTSRLYLRHLSSRTTHFNDAHGIPLFYSMPVEVFSFPVEMVAVKGFALLERFDSLLSRFKSAGIFNYLYRRFDTRTKITTAKLLRESNVHDDDQALRLTLDHLQGAFIALFMGSVAATMVFIGEIIVFRRRRMASKPRTNRKTKTWATRRKDKKNIGYGKRLKRQALNYTRGDFLRLSHWYEKQKRL